MDTEKRLKKARNMVIRAARGIKEKMGDMENIEAEPYVRVAYNTKYGELYIFSVAGKRRDDFQVDELPVPVIPLAPQEMDRLLSNSNVRDQFVDNIIIDTVDYLKQESA